MVKTRIHARQRQAMKSGFLNLGKMWLPELLDESSVI